MSLNLKIRKYPDEILRKEAKIVENPEDYLDLIKEMKKTMIENDGIGLAAPQVGFSIRIITLHSEVLKKDFKNDIKGDFIPDNLINPKVLFYKGEISGEEGCLSFPGLFIEIPRPQFVVLKGLTFINKKLIELEIEVQNLPARVFLHEIDHLNGILFIDRLKPSERKIILAKWIKQQKIKI